ncbi:BRCA1-associated ATM activator 1 isoform X3 [Rhinatrema bivittatum]|uniref:BRCA1-associated ATM activator 1 isoform X3 n=1 Tax=Rhinatrema bivittatum TaxID=194408 RepID=UPI00112EBA12|nr:BRCA1-associated ATM activator 1 isoform X3 [Rhinatrema bivittatum]
MDGECARLLPPVCAVLADPGQPLSDDTCLEKLLDWFRALAQAGSGTLLLQENPCLMDLILQGLRLEEPNPSLLAFILRLAGLFAASESGFQRLSREELLLLSLFGKKLSTSALWDDATVRSGWIQGVHSMAQHVHAIQFLCDCGSLDLILTLQGDTSLFVTSAANKLIVHLLVFSVQSAVRQPLGSADSDWPVCAQRIVAHLERSLGSNVPSRVAPALKAVIMVFGNCHDAWTEILWSNLAQPVVSLLEQEPVCEVPLLVELFLSMASPQGVTVSALRVLLQPLNCILRAALVRPEQPGLLELVPDSSAVENLLSVKSSCIALLCQTLAHLHALQCLDLLPVQLPPESLLHCTLTLLEFCLGLANPSSSTEAKISSFLVGSLRVQRLSLDVLGALSCWTVNSASLAKTFDVLLVYLKSPDSNPTILKKSFQATLKWLLSCSKLSNLQEHLLARNRCLRDLFPLLHKRLSSTCWEVRDTALEFLTSLVQCFPEQDEFKQILQSSEAAKLSWDLLKDPESYVRASAVNALGQLAQTLPGPERINNHQQNLGARFLEILGEDTESFPRRAVLRVFTAWLREGHLESLGDTDRLISKVFELANSDLDWEVKIHGLELAEVFISRTVGRPESRSCPYAAVSPSTSDASFLQEWLRRFGRVKLFEFLLDALCDCDRPVARKSCSILISLKAVLCEKEALIAGPVPWASQGTDWLEETLRSWRSRCKTQQEQTLAAILHGEPNRALAVLGALDLGGLQVALEKSSDHVEKSPRSLLQDILATAGTLDENGADCY